MSDTDVIDNIVRNPIGASAGDRSAANDRDVNERPRYTRRLSDKILIAFHHACDERNLEVARQLLDVLEVMTCRAPAFPMEKDRRAKESLVAANERLWILRHPGSFER